MHHEVLKVKGRKPLRIGLVLALVGVLLGLSSFVIESSLMLFGGLLLLALGLLFLGVWSGINFADKTIYQAKVESESKVKPGS